MPEANDLEAFYQAYYASLWAFLARASGDPALAEDLAQEAFLRLLGSRAEHWPWATRRPYLYRIGLNLLRDRQRRDWREAPLEAVAEPAAPAPGLSLLGRGLASALGRLPERQRSALWLAHVEEMDHQAIATVLGLNPLSVRVVLHRARKRLRVELGGAPEEEPHHEQARA